MTDLPRRAFVATSTAAVVTGLTAIRSRAETMAIDEGRFVRLNGVDQWVAIRGHDAANPVLLILGGGPGVPTSYLAPLFADWTRDFTLALWDQPGSGGTFIKSGGKAGLGAVSVDRYAADGLALSDYLAERFGKKKIVLLGYSWGSMVGLTMVSRRPDRFSAYIGTGQAVDVRRSDELSYGLLLRGAQERGEAANVAALEKLGPPPYDFDRRQTKQQYATALTASERATAPAVGRLLSASAPDAAWNWPKELGPYDARTAFLATQQKGYADAQAWTARSLGLKFRLPMFFFQGEQDLNTVTSLVQEYAAQIEAPRKDLALIPDAGHGIIPYDVAALRQLVMERVRPIT